MTVNETGAGESRPPVDPEKLLLYWMAWERGDVTPGQTLADLKKGGMRDLLESTVQAQRDITGSA